jgi:alpha-tubulin suppressor-like RCC1 family protein
VVVHEASKGNGYHHFDAGGPPRCTSLCIEGGNEERVCAVCDGLVYCWGSDLDDGLGEGVGASSVRAPSPVLDAITASPITDRTQVVCGNTHACALGGDGTVVCWGFDGAGHGLFASTGSGERARHIPLGGTADALAAGQSHTCARIGATLTCWGENAQGQSELSGGAFDTFEHEGDAVTAGHPPFSNVGLFGAARMRTCAVDTTTGFMHCIGLGEYRNGGHTTSGTEPYLVTEDGSVDMPLPFAIGLAMGRAHTCMTDGAETFCLGGNVFGALGGVTGAPDCGGIACTAVPLEIFGSDAHPFERIGSGSGADHTCAAGATGLWCWGRNDRAQCGAPGSATETDTLLVEVPSFIGRRVTAIGLGQLSSCAIVDGEEVWCWGDDQYAQLGTGSPDSDVHDTAVRVVLP